MQADRDRLPALQHRSKEELAYRELRSAILSNRLKAGERLMPNELALRFSVSTMPVRQALMRLEQEKLVARLSNGGMVVAPLSVKEVEEIYSLRAVLEGFAAKLATPRLSQSDLRLMAGLVQDMEQLVSSGDRDRLAQVNARFHFTMYRAAGNALLYEMLHNLWDISSRYRHAYYSDPSVPEETLREHRGTLEALQRKDADEAEALVRADMNETARLLLSVIRDNISSLEEDADGKAPLG